jgi:hypothetical protein
MDTAPKTDFATVEEALAAADARVALVRSAASGTLIDTLDDKAFADWDGSDEMALVGPGR